MTKSPAFSVVVPCFNDGAFLGEAVESVRRAGLDGVELIVVDDGSTDAPTLQVLEDLKARGVHVQHQANQGLAAARNAGIAATQAEYIIPLDADNRLLPAMLTEAARVFSARPRVGVVYGDAALFGQRTGRRRVGPLEKYRLLHWNYIDACAAFRRQVWLDNGGFDGRMPVMGLEDWDFWLGAVERGWEFVHVPEILYEYRVRPGSMIARAFPNQAQVEDYVTAKHARLYRDAFVELLVERNSLRSLGRRGRRLLARKLTGAPMPLS